LPYRRRAGRSEDTEELRARGMPLGLMPQMSYEEKEIRTARASSGRASATLQRASPVEESSTTIVWPPASRRRRRAASLRHLLRYVQRPACSPGKYLLSEVAGYPGFRYARPPRLANRTQSHSSDEQLVDSRVRSSLPRGLCGFRSCQPALPGPHVLFGGSGGDKAHHHEGDEARQNSPDYGGVREQPV
jgi:hypothetical protein